VKVIGIVAKATDGLADSLAVVAARPTTKLRAAEVDRAKPLLPEYTAVNKSVPPGSAAVLKVATPAAFTVAVASNVVPL
jgi:hypothetical protein